MRVRAFGSGNGRSKGPHWGPGGICFASYPAPKAGELRAGGPRGVWWALAAGATRGVGGVWPWRGRGLREKPRGRPALSVGGAWGRAGGGGGGGPHLELVGRVEGDLADFGEALSIAHGVAQRQL